MPHADVNGQRLYYEVHGEGDEPLLCVMGLSADTVAVSYTHLTLPTICSV